MSVLNRDQSTLLIKLAYIIIIVQNIMIYAGIFVASSLLEFMLYVDIIGFALLGLGFVLFALNLSEQKITYLLAGVAFLLWVVFRVYWQFIALSGFTFGNTSDATTAIQDLAESLFQMIFAFFLAALVLFVACVLLWYVLRGADGILVLAFGLVNFIAVALLFLPIFQLADASAVSNAAASLLGGVLLKILVVPALGLICFLALFLKADKLANAT